MEIFGFRCWRGNAGKMDGAHTHLEIEANLILRGTLAYLFGGARIEMSAGQLALFWGSVPHQMIAQSPDNDVFWLTLPLAQFLSWELPRSFTHAVLNGSVAMESSDLKRDSALFADWNEDLSCGEAPRTRIASLEVEARLRRFAYGQKESDTAPKNSVTQGELGHVEKMAAFMAQNYAVALDVKEIAQVAQIHPHYAMSLFKREFGLSLGQFLTRTRLSHAQRLLATSDKKIVEIAYSCGFGSVSRFHAAFKEQFSQSPADYRRHFHR